jgi:hypothetical protein
MLIHLCLTKIDLEYPPCAEPDLGIGFNYSLEAANLEVKNRVTLWVINQMC